jgi:hypothetical protein
MELPTRKTVPHAFQRRLSPTPELCRALPHNNLGVRYAVYSGGMVDLQTGEISSFPTTLGNSGVVHWNICQSAFRPSGIESRVDSRLLVIRCADVIGRDDGNYLHTSYFALENGTFAKIDERSGPRVF